MVHYLLAEDLLLINRMSIQQHGGAYMEPDNLLHESALRYVLEAPMSQYFGEVQYPTLSDKAAVYFFSIISNHVFQDENKRTGLEASLLFLRMNGHTVTVNDSVLESFTLSTASGELTLEEVRAWFAQNVVSL